MTGDHRPPTLLGVRSPLTPTADSLFIHPLNHPKTNYAPIHANSHVTTQMSQNSELHLSLTILILAILLWIFHASYSIYVLFFDDSLEPSSISQMLSR